MTRAQQSPLKLRIASPCTESWDSMKGDERVRHCASCKLNVYNLHEMTMSEVETLLRGRTGRLCARLYQRKDGTVITADCPVGLRKVRMRLAAGLVTSAAFVAAVFATVIHLDGPGGISGFWERHAAFKKEAPKWPVVGPATDTLNKRVLTQGMVSLKSSKY